MPTNKIAYPCAVSFLACCLAIGACSSNSSDKPDTGGTVPGVDAGGSDHPGGTGGDVSGTGG